MTAADGKQQKGEDCTIYDYLGTGLTTVYKPGDYFCACDRVYPGTAAFRWDANLPNLHNMFGWQQVKPSPATFVRCMLVCVHVGCVVYLQQTWPGQAMVPVWFLLVLFVDEVLHSLVPLTVPYQALSLAATTHCISGYHALAASPHQSRTY
jgi:hypothetical protein